MTDQAVSPEAPRAAEVLAMYQWRENIVDALLAHATPDADGTRRVVLEGRSGQDARIRGLERDHESEGDRSWAHGYQPIGPDEELPDWPLYRLTDPSVPEPESDR